MDNLVSIFCHVPNDMPEKDTLQELWRQHDQLAQEAARMGRAVEHCFFHVGKFDLEKPDKVFFRLMQCAQAKELGLLLIENMERFPLSHQAKIPQMERKWRYTSCRNTSRRHWALWKYRWRWTRIFHNMAMYILAFN